MNKQNFQFDANARSATSKNIIKAQQMQPSTRATNLKRKYLPNRNYYWPITTTTTIYYKGDNQLVSFDRQTIPSIQPKARIQFGTNAGKGKRERQQDDGGLLISTRSNTNEMEIQHNIQSIQHFNSRRFISRQKTITKRREQSPRLFALVLSLSLTCIHNASPCSSFGDFERHYYPNIFGNNYPVQLNEQQLLFAQQQSPNHRHHHHQQQQQQWVRMTRSFADPLMEIMSTPTGSFTQDPSSTISPPGAAQSGWTSIFGGFGGSNNNKPQQNFGGDGDSLDKHIKKILVPRISGTPGNVQVRNYIVDELQKNNYHVELDEFTGSTPVGDVKFANIIASSNPNACRQLVLACHYDSKMMEGFLGAIDSAVPCAMLLKMSETFNKSFQASSDFSTSGGGESSKDSLGLRFIFFDGEEAYEQWTQTDSLYGSRHLAAKWAKQPAPSQCTQAGSSKTELERIELFVLLDLIGTSDTSFVMYNTRLKHHYDALQKYERDHLAKSGMSQLQARRAVSFKSRTIPLDFVEDDHVPFKKRGVPILLLLAHPFPKVWHTVADNYDAIDFPKTRRILNVLENFVSNYSAN